MNEAVSETSARRGVALCGVVLLTLFGFALRGWAPGADPWLSLSGSNAEVMDGPWYLAEAIDGARGTPVAVPRHYRLPLITWSARPFFMGGVSLVRAHLWAASWGALLVALGAGAAWSAFGRRAALFAAAFLAFGFVAVGYGRTTVVYGPLAAALAGVFWLHAVGARRRSALVSAWLVLIVTALGIKDTAIVAAPALLVGQIAYSRRPWRSALATLACAAVAALLLVVLVPERVEVVFGKVRGYFGASDPLRVIKRTLRGAFASGFLPKSIVVSALAWLGLSSLTRGRPNAAEERRRWAVTAALGTFLVGWLLVFGLFDFVEPGVHGTPPPPIRYFMPAIVPASILAAGCLSAWLGGRGAAEQRVLSSAKPFRFALWCALGSYWFLGAGLMLAWPWFVQRGGVPDSVRALASAKSMATLAAAAGLLGAAWAWRSGSRRKLLDEERVESNLVATKATFRSALAVVVCMAAFVWVNGARLAPELLHPRWTLQRANVLVARLLGPNARVIGTWAHALTYEHPSAERYLPPERVVEIPPTAEAAGITHLIIDEGWMGALEPAFERYGAPLIPLERLSIRAHPVVVYRMPWATRKGYERTPLERLLERRFRR